VLLSTLTRGLFITLRTDDTLVDYEEKWRSRW
jgi:hypothetical protein